MNKIKYLAALVIGIAGLGFQQAQATDLNLEKNMFWSINSPDLIGTVIPGTLGGGGQAVRDAAMVNTLLGMGGHTQSGTWGNQSNPLYSRTNLSEPPGTVVTIAGNITNSAPIPDGTGPVVITLTHAFQFLVVTYDGQNSGAAVFDISSLHAGDTITLARYAYPTAPNLPGYAGGDLVENNLNMQYRMTSWTLLNPIGGVPDGGTTVMLLGAALGALGMVRRYLSR